MHPTLSTIQAVNAEASRPVSFAEKAFYAAKKAPALKPLHKNSLSFEPVMLKSGLFRPASGVRTVHRDYVLIPSQGNNKVWYQGEELRQDDQRVLLMLLKARAGQEIDNAQDFLPRAFVRDVLGWADSSDSVIKLRASIVRLQNARVRVEYADGGLGLYSFVSSAYIDKNSHKWSVSVSPQLLTMYERSQTYLPMAERLSLGDGLTSWLFSFVKADACFAPFQASDLREWAGKTAYAQKHFNTELRASLERLMKEGTVKKFEIKGGKVTIKKHSPNSEPAPAEGTGKN